MYIYFKKLPFRDRHSTILILDTSIFFNVFIDIQQLLTIEHTGLCDVPHSSSLDNVSDDKLLDGLVLGNTPGTVGAADGLDMSTSLLGTAIVPSLLSLGRRYQFFT
jgi:hypothetical protein